MKLNNVRRYLACVAFFACSMAFAGTATWTNFVANTPDTAYDWSSPGNWQDGYVGGTDPSDEVLIAPTAKVYIKVPAAGVTIKKLSWSDNTSKATIIGDGTLTLCSANGALADLNSLAQIFCTVKFSSANTTMPYVTRAVFCGRVVNEYSSYIVGPSAAISFRFDKYAESAGQERTGDLSDISNFGIGSTPLSFYAPVGADTVSGTWRLVKDSPYATRVSSSAHPLAVGTIVTSVGYLPEGTFLKRVFDDGTIELSAAAQVGGDVTLDFAAFTPDFTAKFPARFYQHGSYMSLVATKTRVQDVARIDMGEYNIKGNNCTLWFGSTSASDVPATIVFNKLTNTGTFKFFDLRNTHIELAGDPDTNTAEFSAARPWTMASALEARVTVTNGITGIVNVLTNFNGTIVKDGAGLLKIGLGESKNKGSFSVEGGTLQILRNISAGDAVPMVKELAISSGATFILPDCGLTVESFSAETGAMLGGSGKLYLSSASGISEGALRNIICLPGAEIDFSELGVDRSDIQLGIPEAQVAGHPAFWVDASKPETVVTNSTGGVLRWNDCRAGEPMFCTNVASAFPTYVYSDTAVMTGKYVRIACVSTATTLEETQTLVWSVPISGIKAVFLVQDPTDGGGVILGRTSARCPNSYYNGSAGGPYFRNGDTSLSKTLIASGNEATPCILHGRFYLDGEEVDGTKTTYKRYKQADSYYSFMQLVEHHVNTNYRAGNSSGPYDLVCDAFGLGFHQPHDYIKYYNGRMRIAEYIIYTNSLSYAERLQTAQYLTKKWLGRNVFYSAADSKAMVDVSGADVTLDVKNGEALAVRQCSTGSLVKDGGGLLYVDGMAADSLDVRAGDAVVASRSRDTEVPKDAWLHMDADDASTITKVEGTAKLAVWSDANGSGRSLRNIRPPTTGQASVAADAINGRTAINLGPVHTSTSGGLIYYDEFGNISPNCNLNIDIWKPPTLYTCFFVYDSTAGGGILMAGIGSDWPGKGMPHSYVANSDNPIFFMNNASYFTQSRYGLKEMSNAFSNAEAVFRRNGELIHPFEEKFLRGVERVTFQYSLGRRADTFGAYGGSNDKGDYYGGLKFGEIILYPRMLSSNEIARVEAYLARKWSGVETPGFGAASATALNVASGATLTVRGLPFETSALSGGGTIYGDVTITPGGTLFVPVAANGEIGCLAISGNAILTGCNTLEVSGYTRKAENGKYIVLTADSLVAGSEWTVVGGRPKTRYMVSVEDNSVYLTIQKPGMSINFK